MCQALCEVFLGSGRSFYPHTRPEEPAPVTGERDLEACGHVGRTGRGTSVEVPGFNRAKSSAFSSRQPLDRI